MKKVKWKLNYDSSNRNYCETRVSSKPICFFRYPIICLYIISEQEFRIKIKFFSRIYRFKSKTQRGISEIATVWEGSEAMFPRLTTLLEAAGSPCTIDGVAVDIRKSRCNRGECNLSRPYKRERTRNNYSRRQSWALPLRYTYHSHH